MMNNQKILLLEGADGTGKTTLAKLLSSELNIPYFKRNNEDFKTSSEESYFVNNNKEFLNSLRFDQTYITQFLKQTGYSVIIDRAWPSEYVYSQVFSRPTDLTLLTELDDLYARLNAKIIITRCSKPFRQDKLVNNEYFKQITHAYDLFVEWTKCETITLDMNILDVNEATDIVISSFNDVL